MENSIMRSNKMFETIIEYLRVSYNELCSIISSVLGAYTHYYQVSGFANLVISIILTMLSYGMYKITTRDQQFFKDQTDDEFVRVPLSIVFGIMCVITLIFIVNSITRICAPEAYAISDLIDLIKK